MKTLLVLALIGLVVLVGCAQSAPAPTLEPAPQAGQDQVIDDIAGLDSLETDMNLTELDSLDADLNFG